MAIRWRHNQVWRFLLKHGTRFEDVRNPEPVIDRLVSTTVPPVEKQCFRNAWALSVVSGGLFVYCEGLATKESFVAEECATLHAWCIHREHGFVVDTTPWWSDSYASKRPFYYGVAFGVDFFEMAKDVQLHDRRSHYGKATLTLPELVLGRCESYPGVGCPKDYAAFLGDRRRIQRIIREIDNRASREAEPQALAA